MLRNLLAPLTFGLLAACYGVHLPADDSRGFAVIELFTSQGCSSCPPADQLLGNIERWGETKTLPVYCLSFHVDYWNRLGWPDPYSSPAYTQRQRAYATAMKSRRVYTPQMIVNGSDAFVGSRSTDAQTAIRKALATSRDVQLQISARTKSERGIVVAYQVRNQPAQVRVNVAAVQSPPANEVPRGENSGKRLSHVNVVRAFQTAAITESGRGEVALTLPEDLPVRESRIVVYLQQPDMAVVAAASRDLGALAK